MARQGVETGPGTPLWWAPQLRPAALRPPAAQIFQSVAFYGTVL